MLYGSAGRRRRKSPRLALGHFGINSSRFLWFLQVPWDWAIMELACRMKRKLRSVGSN
jgi:hypothetical protein